jgi:hypothetical protein
MVRLFGAGDDLRQRLVGCLKFSSQGEPSFLTKAVPGNSKLSCPALRGKLS